MDHGKSSLGIEEGIVAAMTYLGFLGLLMLIIERKSAFVKFHALQSTLAYAFLLGFYMLVKYCNLVYLAWAPGILCLCFTIYMMLRAYYGEEYRLPLIGNLAFHAVYDTSEDLLADDD
jgi:uncharacterized membrane protein